MSEYVSFDLQGVWSEEAHYNFLTFFQQDESAEFARFVPIVRADNLLYSYPVLFAPSDN